MTRHTQEPWRIGMLGAIFADDREIAHVATPLAHDKSGCQVGDANARRIVACVNACAGIPTEALEGGALAEAIAVLADLAPITWNDGPLPKVYRAEGERADTVLAKLRA